MKTITIMDTKAKEFLAYSLYWDSSQTINKIKVIASGTIKLPYYLGDMKQIRTINVVDDDRGYDFESGNLNIYHGDNLLPLMWLFPDGMASIGQTITIELYNRDKTSNSGIQLQIEGGNPTKVMYIEGMTISFRGDE